MRKANSTSFKKGNKGKQPGTQNHLTKTVKETVLAVFNDLQSDPKVNLKTFGRKYPRDFYNIAARLIPTEIQGHFDKIKVEIVRKNSIAGTGSATPEPNEGTSGEAKV